MSSSDMSYDDPLDGQKKRRSSYHARKDEKSALSREIVQLEARLQQLESVEARELRQAVGLHSVLSQDVQQNEIAVAGAQSMISSFAGTDAFHPLTDCIHLTTDPAQRSACLAALYDSKTESATKFLLERTRFLDMTRDHSHIETFAHANGDFVYTLLDVTPFGRSFSTKRIFDELCLSLSHQEISVSESLGILTILEHDDSAPQSMVSQTRLLSTVDGIGIEANQASFVRFVANANAPEQSYGIGAMNFVDVDELHPYRSSDRIRKDITAAAMVAACPSAVGEDATTLPPIVTLTRWISVRLHRPAFEISARTQHLARESVSQWGSVMLVEMKERLGLM